MADVKPDMATVLKHYGFDLPLHRNPNGVKVRCVFHGDRQASAIFNEGKQYFKCFACDRAGDSWQLIMDEEGIDFQAAISACVQREWIERDPVSGGLMVPGGGGGFGLSPQRAGVRRRTSAGVRTRLRRKPRARS